MPEKDEFTFDDDDNFPETDLSDAFADAERETPESMDDPEPPEIFEETEDVMEDPPPPDASEGGGGSKSRTLLLLLLLVVIAAAGAYFLMSPEGMTPEAPDLQKTSKQVVAVPPQPAKVPVPVQPAPQQSAEAQKEVANEKAAMAAPAETTATEKGQAVKPKDEETVAVPVPVPEKPEETKAAAKPADSEKAKQAAPTQPQVTKAAPVPVGTAGTYVLDAGAFLFASQSDDLKKKITELGYKPVVSQVKASVRLIRLRVGSYTKEQLPAALEDVRKIAPGAFSLARDGRYVVYAGSFADQHNIKKLSDRLRAEGIDVVEEPVKVDRNLSRIQFGEFSDDASAEAAAEKVEEAGIPVRVVKK